MKHAVDNKVNKKIIGFDMDGVIIDHMPNKVKLAAEFGFNITKEQTPSEILRTLMPTSQYKELQGILYDHLEVGLSAPLMPGVKEVLVKIKDKKIPYFLISRRKNRENQNMAVKLLTKHGLWPKYFNEKNTYFVREIKDKEIKAKALGITHYIDDERKVLTALVSVKNRFLFDRLGAFPNSEYTRLTSWKEISRLL